MLNKSIIRFGISGLLLLYTAGVAFAENNQFAIEMTNNQAEWNLEHSMASSGRVNHANELMTLLSKPQPTKIEPQRESNQKVEVFDKKGNLIAVKTLNSRGKVIDVEFISQVENIDRKSGATSKNTQSDELFFMENASGSEELVAQLDI